MKPLHLVLRDLSIMALSRKRRRKLKRQVARTTTQPALEVDRCWCGVENPYYEPVRGTCGGMGIIECLCGGDQCVCHHHGEIECLGCVDCAGDDEDDDDAGSEPCAWA